MMKIRLLWNVVLVMIVAVIASSCLNDDDDIIIQSKAEEMIIMNQYISNLEAEGYNIDTTDLGVYYIILEEGEGVYPENGDSLTVGYVAKYLKLYPNNIIAGREFDSSDYLNADGLYNFVLGDSQMIPGWNDGIKQINEGGEIQFIVPSELAYGSEGSGAVGPNRTLIFVVKLFELKQSAE